MVKNLPAKKTRVQSLGQEDPLEEETATHSSSFPWRIPWTEEPGGLQSRGLQRVSHDWVGMHTLYFPQLSGTIKNNPIGPQSQMPWRLIFPSAGSLGLDLESFERNSALVIILLYVCCPPWGMILGCIVTVVLLPTLSWFLLDNLDCRSPLVCSGLFHWWVFWR